MVNRKHWHLGLQLRCEAVNPATQPDTPPHWGAASLRHRPINIARRPPAAVRARARA